MLGDSEAKRLNVGESQHYQTMSECGKPQDGKDEGVGDGFSSVLFDGERRFSLLDPDDPADADRRKNKAPKKVLHFSDGVLEVYSSSSEDENEGGSGANETTVKCVGGKNDAAADPKSMKWVPWLVSYVWLLGSGVLGYCDFFGEKLAWVLGITSPKYYYELQEFERMKEEEAERKKREGVEAHGWNTAAASKNAEQIEMKQPTTLSPANLVEEHAEQQKNVDYANGGGSGADVGSAAAAAEEANASSEPSPGFVDFDPESSPVQEKRSSHFSTRA